MELPFSTSFSPDAKKTCYKIIEVNKKSGSGVNLGFVKWHHSKTSLTFDTFQKVDC
jgi:hypothetical protein